MNASETWVFARKRELWEGHARVEQFVEDTKEEYGPQRLKNSIETDIVRRFLIGRKLLDVGIGTGRVSLPLAEGGQSLTGLDASAAMIERCAGDSRARDVRLVRGELEQLPFDANEFDTVLSADTLAHYPNWEANLDELLRVTRVGGRIIVDVGSLDHIRAVARSRGSSVDSIGAAERTDTQAYVLRLSTAELLNYAATRNVSLVAIVPYGLVLGGLVRNYWLTDSYAFRCGAIDRLVSWIGADPLLFATAEFIERRIAQACGPEVSGRCYVVFENQPSVSKRYDPFRAEEIEALDERGAAVWRAELRRHAEHEPSRALAVALLLAAWPLRLSKPERAQLPPVLLNDLELAEKAKEIDDRCARTVAAWISGSEPLTFHGVDLRCVFAPRLERELRDRLEAGK